MLDALDIIKLYENVIACDIERYYLSERSIKYGIECMAEVYKPKQNGLHVERSVVADYTDPAHRCAYLHKYAAFHTIMVRDMLYAGVQANYNLFYQMVFSGDAPFRICSLGGGPGTDIIGALAALHSCFSFFQASATVVDYMVDWSYSFGSILSELGTGYYGAFGNNTSSFLNWRYVGANLLKTFNNDILEALSSASLVTMIKFASAAACVDTKSMIKNIFEAMKPGSTILFIDNDGGGFHNIMVDAAIEFGFIPLYGPLRREVYEQKLMRIKRFGYTSCCRSTLTVHLLQKPWKNQTSLLNQRPSLLGSPLTPMLYRPGEMENNPAEYPPPDNYAETQHFQPLTIQIENCPDYGDYPPPVDYYAENGQIENRPDYGDYPPPVDYYAENGHFGPAYSSPISEIPHMPHTPLPVYSPYPTPENPRHSRRGCIPLRLKHFRHHIAQKINKVKKHAKKILKKKNKKLHPIFQI